MTCTVIGLSFPSVLLQPSKTLSGTSDFRNDWFAVDCKNIFRELWKQYPWLTVNLVRCNLISVNFSYNWSNLLAPPPPVFTGISCVGKDGESANMTECLQWAGPLPPQIRECRVACKDDCTLTAWSKFSECTGCGSSRGRKRSLTGKAFSLIHTLWDINIIQVNNFIFTNGGLDSLLRSHNWFLVFKCSTCYKHLLLWTGHCCINGA